MFLNNELCQYSSLISDRRIPSTPLEAKESTDGDDDYNIELLKVKDKHKSAVVVPKAIEKTQSVPIKELGTGLVPPDVAQ